MASIEWSNPPAKAWGELADAYREAIHRGVRAIARRWQPEIENWMKEEAPWTDRTGNARQTLHVEVESVTRNMVRIVMAHGMDYGIYLELSNSGRYAIIGPALDHFAPLIWRDVVRLVSA